MIEFKKFPLNKEDIMVIEKVKFNDQLTKDRNYFDPKAAFDIFKVADVTKTTMFYNQLQTIIRKQNDDAEMCMVCEMAIAYLDLVQKLIKEGYEYGSTE